MHRVCVCAYFAGLSAEDKNKTIGQCDNNNNNDNNKSIQKFSTIEINQTCFYQRLETITEQISHWSLIDANHTHFFIISKTKTNCDVQNKFSR